MQYYLKILPLFAITPGIAQYSSEINERIDVIQQHISSAVHDSTIIKLWQEWDNLIYIFDTQTDQELNQKIDSLVSLNLKKKLSQSEKSFFLNAGSNASNVLGIIHKDRGNIPKALTYYNKSLTIKEKLGDYEGLALVQNNLAIIHADQKDYKTALSYFHTALHIQNSRADKKGEAVTFNNLAIVYENINKIDSALLYYKQSLNIQKELGNKIGIALLLNNLGVIYEKQKQLDTAQVYFTDALALRHEIGDKKGIASTLKNLGNVALQSGNIKKAQAYAELGLSIAKELGYPIEIEINADLLVHIYSQIGNYQSALKMRNLSIQMKDSLLAKDALRAAANQHAKYEYEKRKALNDAENEKKAVITRLEHQKIQEKQKLYTRTIAGGLIIVFSFLIFVFNRLKITKKQKLVIETTHQNLEKSHHLIEEKNKEILDSLNYAKRIQSAIFPSLKTIHQNLPDSFILYKPKDIVAGDFYWLERKDNKIFFAAADCTGHGVPGALVSVICNNSLNRSLREYNILNPGMILDKTCQLIIEEFEKSEDDVKDGMDIALCCLENNALEYAGANNPLWIIRNAQLIEIKASKQPIGKFTESQPFTTHKIDLIPGDTIYIFSDGYADQFGGEKGKKLKAKAFKELILGIQLKTMSEQHDALNSFFERWRGKLEQIDDVCIFAVRI